MTCDSCGAEVEEYDIICPQCGVLLEINTDRITVIN